MVLNEKNDYNTIIQSNHSTIWAGTTSDGIIQIKIDPQTLKVKQIKKYNIQNGLLAAANVKYLYQDNKKIYGQVQMAEGCVSMTKMKINLSQLIK